MSLPTAIRSIWLGVVFGGILLVSLASGLWPVLLLFFHPEAACDGKILSEQISPDGGWIGLVRQEICADGVSITTVNSVVQIVRPGNQPTQANSVFAADDDGNDETRPRLQWTSSTTLQITVPNRSLIGLRKDYFEGISITLQYDPDDPADLLSHR